MPMGALGCVSDARIEAIAGIEAFVVILQRRLRVVQVTYIMFGRIFGAPLVEKLPDLMIQSEPATTRVTMRTPKASARMLLVLSGAVVM